MRCTLNTDHEKPGEAITNEDRLTGLHCAHYADLVRYFFRRGMHSDADELAAEVFVIAWQKLPADIENPRPWLFGVARKVLGNARRTRERKRSLDVPIDPDAGDADVPRVSTHSGAIALRVDLQRAWNRLAESDQEILALTAWEGLTAAEAAHVLGLRRSGAAMRLSRARERLRLLLSPTPTPTSTEQV
ncbi:sigma-70 family RNA polymerase sigma factor [Herbiconiux sp. CPCC 205763]|uniref:Sigma-70 family RNA polymerase sigma factor n=1 Tax=Herbiconiux aconitum TaxID=2970913 RepID=A0ABT2GVM9_9MICO|nr:sigma-70 family RNA polymerase sigma factor [Herbiconiux aconitum]MCS5719325.1 sigma-70 family RNA polymerase sigma factor [Herbiconiux aconitum]